MHRTIGGISYFAVCCRERRCWKDSEGRTIVVEKGPSTIPSSLVSISQFRLPTNCRLLTH